MLSYCDNHWKANAIMTLIYSQWYYIYSRNRKLEVLKNQGQSDNKPAIKKCRTKEEPYVTPSSPLGSQGEIAPTLVPETLFKDHDIIEPPAPQVKEQGPSQPAALKPRARPLVNPL